MTVPSLEQVISSHSVYFANNGREADAAVIGRERTDNEEMYCLLTSSPQDKANREQILARIREETRKTFELNNKYRDSIHSMTFAHDKRPPSGVCIINHRGLEIATLNI